MYPSSNNTNMSLSPLLFDQVDMQLSGQSGETGTNGVIINAIPRSGGNRFCGTALVNGTGPDLQGATSQTDWWAGAEPPTVENALRHQRRVGGPIKPTGCGST